MVRLTPSAGACRNGAGEMECLSTMRALSVFGATLLAGSSLTLLAARPSQAPPAAADTGVEKHLKNIRQLTEGGENAEAYFSQDGTRLIYQSTRPDYPC